MQHTLVAVFDNRSDAQNAMDELLASGFTRTDVNVSSADPTGQTDSLTGATDRVDETHEHGIGASIKHFFAGLFGSDNDEHVNRYSDVVARGHHVLTLVTHSEPDVERAADVIERFGPVDLDERHDLTGSAASLDAGMLAAGASAGSGLNRSASMSAPLSSQSDALGAMQGNRPGALQGGADEDRNFFGTQNINDPFPKDTTYQEPMGGNMQAGGSMDSAIGGNTLSGTQSSSLDSGLSSSRQTSQGGSLSQTDSQLQGTRSLQGSDDASLGGTARVAGGSLQGGSQSGSLQRDVTKLGSMRVVSRDPGAMSSSSRQYASGADDNAWRSDWDSNYSSLGGSYDDYAPAYRYGAEARGKYQGRNWDEVESDLRSDWDTRYGKSGASTWEKFKAAVRHGWDKITPDMDDDSTYRKHWSSTYAGSGDSYDDYEPAYRYGNEMRSSDKYRGRHWDDVESDLRSDWETRNSRGGMSTWEKMKAAVRHGWDRMTD